MRQRNPGPRQPPQRSQRRLRVEDGVIQRHRAHRVRLEHLGEVSGIGERPPAIRRIAAEAEAEIAARLEEPAVTMQPAADHRGVGEQLEETGRLRQPVFVVDPGTGPDHVDEATLGDGALAQRREPGDTGVRIERDGALALLRQPRRRDACGVAPIGDRPVSDRTQHGALRIGDEGFRLDVARRGLVNPLAVEHLGDVDRGAARGQESRERVPVVAALGRRIGVDAQRHRQLAVDEPEVGDIAGAREEHRIEIRLEIRG